MREHQKNLRRISLMKCTIEPAFRKKHHIKLVYIKGIVYLCADESLAQLV